MSDNRTLGGVLPNEDELEAIGAYLERLSVIFSRPVFMEINVQGKWTYRLTRPVEVQRLTEEVQRVR